MLSYVSSQCALIRLNWKIHVEELMLKFTACLRAMQPPRR